MGKKRNLSMKQAVKLPQGEIGYKEYNLFIFNHLMENKALLKRGGGEN